jgi:hypothetical protein
VLAIVAAGAAGALVGGWSADDSDSSAAAVSPSDHYAGALTDELATLAKLRAAALVRLRNAESAASQAEAAGALAKAYVGASRRIGELGAPAAAATESARLARALHATAAAYLLLADAANQEDADAYQRQRAAVRDAELASRDAVAATLDAAGASP